MTCGGGTARGVGRARWQSRGRCPGRLRAYTPHCFRPLWFNSPRQTKRRYPCLSCAAHLGNALGTEVSGASNRVIRTAPPSPLWQPLRMLLPCRRGIQRKRRALVLLTPKQEGLFLTLYDHSLCHLDCSFELGIMCVKIAATVRALQRGLALQAVGSRCSITTWFMRSLAAKIWDAAGPSDSTNYFASSAICKP